MNSSKNCGNEKRVEAGRNDRNSSRNHGYSALMMDFATIEIYKKDLCFFHSLLVARLNNIGTRHSDLLTS